MDNSCVYRTIFSKIHFTSITTSASGDAFLVCVALRALQDGLLPVRLGRGVVQATPCWDAARQISSSLSVVLGWNCHVPRVDHEEGEQFLHEFTIFPYLFILNLPVFTAYILQSGTHTSCTHFQCGPSFSFTRSFIAVIHFVPSLLGLKCGGTNAAEAR